MELMEFIGLSLLASHPSAQASGFLCIGPGRLRPQAFRVGPGRTGPRPARDRARAPERGAENERAVTAGFVVRRWPSLATRIMRWPHLTARANNPHRATLIAHRAKESLSPNTLIAPLSPATLIAPLSPNTLIAPRNPSSHLASESRSAPPNTGAGPGLRGTHVREAPRSGARLARRGGAEPRRTRASARAGRGRVGGTTSRSGVQWRATGGLVRALPAKREEQCLMRHGFC